MWGAGGGGRKILRFGPNRAGGGRREGERPGRKGRQVSEGLRRLNRVGVRGCEAANERKRVGGAEHPGFGVVLRRTRPFSANFSCTTSRSDCLGASMASTSSAEASAAAIFGTFSQKKGAFT